MIHDARIYIILLLLQTTDKRAEVLFLSGF